MPKIFSWHRIYSDIHLSSTSVSYHPRLAGRPSKLVSLLSTAPLSLTQSRQKYRPNSMSLPFPQSIPTSYPEADDSSLPNDYSVNPRISTTFLAVTSTVCVLIVAAAAILIFFLVRRRRMKRKSLSISRQSSTRPTLSARTRARGSRVRQNGNTGRQNSWSSISTYDLPKNNIHEPDPRVVEELDLQVHRTASTEPSNPPNNSPPPYGMR